MFVCKILTKDELHVDWDEVGNVCNRDCITYLRELKVVITEVERDVEKSCVLEV